MDIAEASAICSDVLDEVATAVVADRSFFETVFIGVLSRGHVLLEEVPGTGKTLTARCFATALGLSFSRIQFTPDLLPTDVTGSQLYDERDGTFEFSEGPVFANVVLGDEINRAPAKTQAALLEAMAERQVTTQGETRPLPDPFVVIATQNPIESEGVFPLPEAQIDRFTVKAQLGYPDHEGEIDILRRRLDRETRSPDVEPVLSGTQVRELQRVPETVRVDADTLDYIGRLARATREDRRVDVGVSPRGTQQLLEACRARAVMQGRGFVTPDDVKGVAHPVLAHRLVLTADARINGIDGRTVVDDVLGSEPVPTVDGIERSGNGT
ncbi:AAA family ATPase [Natrinema longum]|uniref:MoxR family ATPase n=1 Tax=Natrinema longum TaxID=370324 RepID=A0A8A2U8J5_9EURY|nr:MoxR family ATPase [Natrinema longum]MBZ6493683.1 MoxR family ATPase [Natrinema longum]QSW84977.1 MoxR family ATPase [Natrinema longum]